jgi:hypothetical protein
MDTNYKYSERSRHGYNLGDYSSIYPSLKDDALNRNSQRLHNVPLSHLTASSPKVTTDTRGYIGKSQNRFLSDLPLEGSLTGLLGDRFTERREPLKNDVLDDSLKKSTWTPLSNTYPRESSRNTSITSNRRLQSPLKYSRNEKRDPIRNNRDTLPFRDSLLNNRESGNPLLNINRDYYGYQKENQMGDFSGSYLEKDKMANRKSPNGNGWSPIKSLNSPYSPSNKVPPSIYRVIDSTPRNSSSSQHTSNRISKPNRQREGYFTKLRKFLGGLDIPIEPSKGAEIKKSKRVTFDTETKPAEYTRKNQYDFDNDEVDELIQNQKRMELLNNSQRVGKLENELIELQQALDLERQKNINLQRTHNDELRTLERSYKEKLQSLNSELASMKRQKELDISRDSETKLQNERLKQKNLEIQKQMEDVREDVEFELKRIREQERTMKSVKKEQDQAMKTLKRKLEEQSQQLFEKEEFLQTQQADLEYKSIELREAEIEMKNLEIENRLRIELNKIKESIEQGKFDLSKENLHIRTMLDRNMKDYQRFSINQEFKIPLDTSTFTSYDKILDNIENEIMYIRKSNGLRILDEVNIKNNEELIKTLNDHLKTSKKKAESKIKEFDDSLLSRVPRFDHRAGFDPNSIHKIYIKKHRCLRKLEKINEVLTRLKILEEYHDDSKILQKLENDGVNSNQFYNTIKSEIERKFIL